MSYSLFSFNIGEDQDILQWNNRSLEGEIQSFEGRTLVPAFNKYLNSGKAHIMEGGCGLGAWCEWFKEKGHNVVGIDYNKTVVERGKLFNPESSVVHGDITCLEYPDNSFDAYVSLGVIEHFEHGPDKALAEAFRILKPGGIAFVSTPYLTIARRFVTHPIRSLYFFLQRLRGRPSYFWEYRFTHKELQGFLEKAGFEIIDWCVDDYEPNVKNRHIGLWADWFFLRRSDGEIWELKPLGQAILKVLRVLPATWSCSGLLLICRANKSDTA